MVKHLVHWNSWKISGQTFGRYVEPFQDMCVCLCVYIIDGNIKITSKIEANTVGKINSEHELTTSFDQEH